MILSKYFNLIDYDKEREIEDFYEGDFEVDIDNKNKVIIRDFLNNYTNKKIINLDEIIVELQSQEELIFIKHLNYKDLQKIIIEQIHEETEMIYDIIFNYENEIISDIVMVPRDKKIRKV